MFLHTYQTGFRKKHPTGQNFKRIDKNVMTGMILVDLQKAFDRINDDVHLRILYAIGFLKHTVNRIYPINDFWLI